MMQNYKAVLQYDGTRYDGWQKQENTEKTIQGKLELLLSRIAGLPVQVHGSGRTDAGVHAMGQVANFCMDTELSAEELRVLINSYLPTDILVTSLEPAPERFHSRLNAKRKTYVYRMAQPGYQNVFLRNYVTFLEEPVDTGRMREAARLLLGEHDFKSFCSKKKIKKSTVRRIDSIVIEEKEGLITIRYTGNGFLYHMVRILTGTLTEVGAGKREPQEIPLILEKKDRQAAGFLMPPQGLFLEKVEY